MAAAVRADEFLARAGTLPFVEPEALLDLAPALVLAPHPDDESLGCGGLIATLAGLGAAPTIVVLSDGTGSHPGSTAYPAPRLKALREAEAREAVIELGLGADAVTFLGLPDRHVPHPGSEGFAPAVDRLAPLAQGARTLLVTWRHDPHGDHQAAYGLARALQARLGPRPRLLEYPIWGWTLPPGTPLSTQEPCGFRLDAAACASRKRRAVAAHRSQVTALIDDDPNGFRLPDAFVTRFLEEPEIFLEMPP